MSGNSSSAEIRAGLSHPIIDADGHLIEFLPAIRDYLREEGGASAVEAFDAVVHAQGRIDAMSFDERRAAGLFKLWDATSMGLPRRASSCDQAYVFRS